MKSIQKNWLKGMLFIIVILTFILGAQFNLIINNKVIFYILIPILIMKTLYDMYESAFERKYKTIFLILLSDLSIILMMMIIIAIISKPLDITNWEAIFARSLSMGIINFLFLSVMIIRNFLKAKRFEKGNIGEKQDEKQDHAD